jgi:hypothetical protein
MTLRFSFLFFVVSAAVCLLLLSGTHRFSAQSTPGSGAVCWIPRYSAIVPREVEFPYYNLTNGWISTLNLVSDSPQLCSKKGVGNM